MRLSSPRFVVSAQFPFQPWFVQAVVLAALCVHVACAVAEEAEPPKFVFAKSGIRFDSNFDGGRLASCKQLDDDRFQITIEPESAPINNSAWYAFRVTAKTAKNIALKLVYRDGTHRYRPWVSSDRERWKNVDEESYVVGPQSVRATLHLSVGPGPLWVAAQPLITEKELAAWTKTLAAKEFVKRSVIGHSVRGQAIESFEISARASRNYVYIISRQHPPEVTGHQGMMDAVDQICGDTELASRFREHFTTLCVPLVNPDGVADGNWRNNAGGRDLNRDWGQFHQPETKAVRDALLATLAKDGARPFLFLDYHSTFKDMYFTQPDSQPTFPPRFTQDWLTAIERRMPDHEVIRDTAPGSSLYTSRHWVNQTLGIPAITVEFGDNSTAKNIRRVSRVAAEEMMQRLLTEVDPQ
jgi:hypothetical protein